MKNRELEQLLDEAEAKLIEIALEGHFGASVFLLSNQRRRRREFWRREGGAEK